ncbi:MAG: hypothetical protein AB1656_22235 [Candidatus Omnitrophota bacterium]
MQEMFGDFRLDVGGNVLDDSRTNAVLAVALLERSAAIGKRKPCVAVSCEDLKKRMA